MRSKPTILTPLALAALVTLAAAAAFGQPPGDERRARGMHGHGRDGGRDLTEFLGLTDEQEQQWRDAHRSHFESLRPTFEKIRDVREQLRAELEESSPDAATVGGFVIQIHELDAELESSHAELETTLRGILTDEQETKLEAWKAANPPRRGFGHGGPGWEGRRHGGPGRGPGHDNGDDSDA